MLGSLKHTGNKNMSFTIKLYGKVRTKDNHH